MVKKLNGKWCVVHAHPKRPGSKTDKPPGTPEGKRKADAMHTAILLSQQRQN